METENQEVQNGQENQEAQNQVDENQLYNDDFVGDENMPTQEDITREIVGEEPKVNEQDNNQQEAPKGELSGIYAHVESQIKQVDPEYQLPEHFRTRMKEGKEISEQELHDELVQTIVDNVEFEAEKDPFVQGYLQAKAKGVTPQQYVQSLQQSGNIMQMPTNEFLSRYYGGMKDAQGNNRYTNEQIQQFINSKTPIELDQMAVQYKQQYAQQQQQVYVQQHHQQLQQQIEQDNQRNAQIVNSYVQKLQGQDNIYGIPLAEGDKADVIKGVQSMFVRDQQGTNEFERSMGDDEFVLEIAPFIYLAKQGKLNGLISAIKETAKKNAVENLDPTPQHSGSGGTGSGGVNEAKIYEN